MAQKTRHESQPAHQGKAPENSTSSLPPDRRKHFVAICLQLLTNFGEKKTRSSAKSVCYKKPQIFFRLRSKTLWCSIISQTHFNKPPNPFGDPEISLCVCVCVSVSEGERERERIPTEYLCCCSCWVPTYKGAFQWVPKLPSSSRLQGAICNCWSLASSSGGGDCVV
jgi:hypothetical protein